MANSEYNLNKNWFSILKLAKGDLTELVRLTKMAKTDFRDVIKLATCENEIIRNRKTK